MYKAFFTQLLVVHLVPDCLIDAFLFFNMLQMRYSTSKLIIRVHEATRSIMAIVLILLGLTCYNCMDLLNCAGRLSFLGQAIIIYVYIYISVQAIVGHIFLFLILVHMCTWLRQCISGGEPESQSAAELSRVGLEQDSVVGGNRADDDNFIRIDSDRFREETRMRLDRVGAQEQPSPATFLKLTESIYDQKFFKDSTVCSICIETLGDGQKIITLPCDMRHYFHSHCIIRWSEESGKSTCPLCKEPYTEEKVREFNPRFREMLLESVARHASRRDLEGGGGLEFQTEFDDDCFRRA